jgi:hypothetical protein
LKRLALRRTFLTFAALAICGVARGQTLEGFASLPADTFAAGPTSGDPAGFLIKHEVVDLLQIADPSDLGGLGPVFTFPFQTIESVIPLGSRRLGILDDNNYPFSSARNPGEPD